MNFSLKKPDYVAVKLCNPLGQLLKNIFEGNMISGEHNLRIDTAGLTSGTYFVVLKVRNEISSTKLNVIKEK